MNTTHWTRPYRWALFPPIWAVVSIAAFAGDSRPAVDFNRDIRPILSDTCFTCHGPDEATRQVDLRLDTREGLYEDRGGYRVVVGRDLDNSRLFQRISTEIEVARMPPPKSQRKLTPSQIELIRRWIEQGAIWERHWAFVGPDRPKPPKVRNQDWPDNEIDVFVLERLEREGLAPSAAADRGRLIRRVTLDLTGLPPTPAEVEAFLRDTAPNAYERVVDRLLASPRYGERMAWRWLEAARYADTDGYQTDGERFMWRWRDWVIGAFNSNMPFDQFTVEQIAGDMLAEATLEQKIATGFNRNHRGNAEGGIIAEEYRVEYVVDRVDTTSTVWLGLTTGCARCHDHKYDPIRQKEYYELFAFFNNVPEQGRSIKHGNSPPVIAAPTPSQQALLRGLEHRVKAAEEKFTAMTPKLGAVQSGWEKSLRVGAPIDWTIVEGLAANYPLDGDIANTGGEHGKDEVPKARFHDGEPNFVAGRFSEAASFDGRRYIDCGDVAKFGYLDKFSLGAWIRPSGGEGAILSRVADTDEAEGYSLYLEDGKIRLDLSKRWLDDALRVETEDGLSPGWHHVMATYDASRVASGVKIYVDGKPVKLRVLLDGLNQTFHINEPFRIGAVGGTKGRFHGYIDDVRVYARALEADEVAIVAHPDSITDIARTTPEKRTPAQRIKIGRYFLEELAPEPIRRTWQDLSELRQEKVRLLESIPTTMVMKEMKQPRDTFVLLRGAYDKPGEQVQAGLPAFLPPLPTGEENDRLGFARWLVDRSNPLTARVTVNRFWQMYFGRGLVETVENFGSQGELPTHPELLDWLATEFMRTGWDVKAIQKTIVTSTTYRQSSKVTGELLKRDPENRLLARGPRFRLSSEIVRDQTLAVSGLLVERLGGPSVRPYQPEGLWLELSTAGKYKQDKGENLYRRSLYTFWKRTVPPPSMMTFDASDRETCIVRETRTNTPLQALTLMNGVTYVEASRALAERVLAGPAATPEERISAAFQFVLARAPAQAERAIIIDGLRHHRDHYRSNESEALELVSAGESPRNGMLDPSEARRLHDGSQHDLEPRRDSNPGVTVNPEMPTKLRMTRRHFFGRVNASIGTAALASLLDRELLSANGTYSATNDATDNAARADLPHFAPRAKRVIYLFQSGGPSQMDLFDYKPKLDDHLGTELPGSVRMGQRLTTMTSGQTSFPIVPPAFQFARHGECGAWVSELLPHTAKIVDELCFIRSMHTEAINHDPAITFFQTGAQLSGRPSIGSWLSYGLGSANKDLPAFIVMISQGTYPGQPLYDRLWGSAFLPTQHQGVKFRSVGDPVLHLSNPPGLGRVTRRRLLDDLARLNQLKLEEFGDPEIATRIAQYEMAFRMQSSVPELTDLSTEPDSVFDLYGPESRKPGTYAANCLLARRLAERGVRFIQLFHRGWDQHRELPEQHRARCDETDRATAALIQDLKQRGLLEDTLVVWGGEFGRTVYCQGRLDGKFGRDHHPRCFTIWMAGAGIRPGFTFGETDDYSYNITRDPVHVHDLQATILHCLGIDHTQLTYKFQGRRFRLTDVHGNVVNEILS